MTQHQNPDDWETGNVLQFGPFRLLPRERRLERDGEQIKLGDRALDLLIYLAANAPDVVSKAELTKRVWSNAVVEEGNLRFQIAALRRALADGGTSPYLTTVHGRGYCFIASVSRSRSNDRGTEATRSEANPRPSSHPRGEGREVEPVGTRIMPPDLAAQPAKLFGRHTELAAMLARLDAIEDAGGALVIRGDAGIGKSALLRETARHASEHGFDIIRATAVQSEVDIPFAALHQLLLPLLGVVEALPGASRDALQSAFGSNDASPPLFLIAVATLQLLGERDDRAPLLVLVDDAQWLDSSSAEVLTFVARRLQSDPILLLFAIRDGYESPILRAALPELALHALDETAAGELLESAAPALPHPIRERILRDAQGNPLALWELPIAVRSAGIEGGLPPPSLPLTARLTRIFSQRVAALSVATRQFLLIVAADDSGDLAEILAAGKHFATQDQFSLALSEASAAGLVDVDASIVRFRHPLIRSAIYETAKLAERQAVHVALADVVCDEDRRAWHLSAGVVGVDEKMASTLDDAAARATWRGAFSAALPLMERAARMSSSASVRATRLLWAVRIASNLGRQQEMKRLLAELQDNDLPTALRHSAVFEREIANQAPWTGVAAAGSIVESVDRLRSEGFVADALAALVRFSLRVWWSNPDEATRSKLIDAVERLALPGDDPDVVSVIALVAPIERGTVSIERMQRIARGELPAVPQHNHNLGVAATAVGDFVLAERFLEAAVANMRAKANLGILANALMSRAWAGVLQGNWRLATQSADESARLSDEQEDRRRAAVARFAAAMIAAYQGDIDRVEELAARGEREFLLTSANPMLALVQLVRGAACLSSGRSDEAYEQLRRIYDPTDIAYHPHLRAWALVDLVEAALQSNRLDEIDGLVTEQERVFALAQWPLLKVHLDVVAALLSSDDRAEGSYRKALESNPTASPFIRGRLQLAYGVWLKRHRRTADSRPRFRAALEIFNALGAEPWAKRASRELRASGETNRRAPPTAGWLALSPQELQIAELAADGLSNKEIAQQLFLSHRTVGSHLYRIYPKLAIKTRSQLHAALREQGVTED